MVVLVFNADVMVKLKNCMSKNDLLHFFNKVYPNQTDKKNNNSWKTFCCCSSDVADS